MLVALTTHTQINDNKNKKDGRKLLMIVGMFMALMAVMVSQVYTYSQTH